MDAYTESVKIGEDFTKISTFHYDMKANQYLPKMCTFRVIENDSAGPSKPIGEADVDMSKFILNEQTETLEIKNCPYQPCKLHVRFALKPTTSEVPPED